VSRGGATVVDVSGTRPPEWRSYQELTEELMRRLGAADGITTLRLEREVPMSGRATDNCIDVLWEVQGSSGEQSSLSRSTTSSRTRAGVPTRASWPGWTGLSLRHAGPAFASSASRTAAPSRLPNPGYRLTDIRPRSAPPEPWSTADEDVDGRPCHRLRRRRR